MFFKQVIRRVIARLVARSSIPETPVLEPIGRGVLDHPLEPALGRRLAPTRGRVMTTESVACISQDTNLHSRDGVARVLRHAPL